MGEVQESESHWSPMVEPSVGPFHNLSHFPNPGGKVLERSSFDGGPVGNSLQNSEFWPWKLTEK